MFLSRADFHRFYDRKLSGSCRLGSFSTFLATFSSGESLDPTVLHLGSAVVLTKSAEDNYIVTCNGLVLKGIISVSTVSTVCTVYSEGVTKLINDVHVAVLCVVNFLDVTCYKVLFFGVSVVILSCSDLHSFGNGYRSSEGLNPTVLHLGSTVVLTKSAEDNYIVTCNGLVLKSIISVSTVSTVSAVYGEGVTKLVNDVHVTVLCVVNFLNDTCYDVLFFGVGVVILGCTDLNSILDRSYSLGKLNREFLS